MEGRLSEAWVQPDSFDPYSPAAALTNPFSMPGEFPMDPEEFQDDFSYSEVHELPAQASTELGDNGADISPVELDGRGFVPRPPVHDHPSTTFQPVKVKKAATLPISFQDKKQGSSISKLLSPLQLSPPKKSQKEIVMYVHRFLSKELQRDGHLP
jgi:hypothetical protein